MKTQTLFILLLILPLFIKSQFLIKETAPLKTNLTSLVISLNNKIVVGTEDKDIIIINTLTGTIDKKIPAHDNFVFCVAYDRKKTIATAGWDNKIIIWDAISMKIVEEIDAQSDRINELKFSANGKFLASASSDNTVIIWKTNPFQKVCEIKDHKKPVTCISFSKNGKLIASGGWDNTVMIHSTTDGKLIKTLSGHSRIVNSVNFSADNKYLASGGQDNTCIVWSVDDGSIFTKFSHFKSSVNNVVFTNNPKILFCTETNGDLKIFDIEHKRLISQTKLHNGSINGLYINNNTMATSGEDQVVKFWNIGEYIYLDCVNEKLKDETEIKAAKTADESDIQYKARMRKYEILRMNTATECMKEEKERKKVEQEILDQEILSTYKYISKSVEKIGNFDTESQTCTIYSDGIEYKIAITEDEAKSLKGKSAEAKIRYIEYNDEGSTETINRQLIHPVSKKVYPLGEQVNPAEDKILRMFLAKQKQS